MAEIAEIDATKVIDVPKEDVCVCNFLERCLRVASGAPALCSVSVGEPRRVQLFGMTASSGTGANHVHILFD